MRKMRIGSRGSPLALWQARWIAGELERRHPGLGTSIEIIRTSGDRLSEADLLTAASDAKGLFVKEIEQALLGGEIDAAVHSLKDVPAELPAGLTLSAFPSRQDARDALVLPDGKGSWESLAQGAAVATGSPRRQAQLMVLRPDLRIGPIRGNVDTRLRKLQEGEWDGLILAAAGLERLELAERISHRFSLEELVPAVGQGALAVETRQDDAETIALLKPLHDLITARNVGAERLFLQRMGGGCSIPLGAHAQTRDESVRFVAFLGDVRGRKTFRVDLRAEASAVLDLAARAADALLEQGAAKVLEGFEQG